MSPSKVVRVVHRCTHRDIRIRMDLVFKFFEQEKNFIYKFIMCDTLTFMYDECMSCTPCLLVSCMMYVHTFRYVHTSYIHHTTGTCSTKHLDFDAEHGMTNEESENLRS